MIDYEYESTIASAHFQTPLPPKPTPPKGVGWVLISTCVTVVEHPDHNAYAFVSGHMIPNSKQVMYVVYTWQRPRCVVQCLKCNSVASHRGKCLGCRQTMVAAELDKLTAARGTPA